MVQNDRVNLSVMLHISGTIIIRLSFMVHICKIIMRPGFFFHFFKVLIFVVVSRVKGQKMVQNDKKFCLYVSRTIHDMKVIMVHICKMIKSPGVFFLILILQIVSRVKGQKMTQNDKKLSLALLILGTIHNMVVIYGTHV